MPSNQKLASKHMGRPSIFTDDLAATICRRIADGESLRSVCRDADMPGKATVLRWLDENEEFRDQYARAREAQADHFAEEILEIADDATNDFMDRKRKDGSLETVVDAENIQRSRLRVDARKWLMARMAPKKYGSRIVQVGDENDESVIVNILSFADSNKLRRTPGDGDNGGTA